MRTTIDLPDPLFKQVKARAALQGMKLRDFIAGCLKNALQHRMIGTKPYCAKLPLIKGGKPGSLHLTNEMIAAMESREEVERYAKFVRH